MIIFSQIQNLYFNMKALFILILFALIALVSQAQTTTAQIALKSYEDGFLNTNWTGMTATQKNAFVAEHYRLKILAAKEIEANRVAAEAQQATDNAARKQQIITYLKNHGFACDNSKADWDKLYNRPKVFGANWQAQSDYQQSISTGVDYFLNVAYGLWLEFVKNE